MVIWLTGLSSSGKSTIAKELKDILILCNCSRKVQILDGDILRNGLCEDLKFNNYDRYENIRRIRHTAKLLSDLDIIVIVAAITPYMEMRWDNYDLLGNDYVEVFVNADIEKCIKRDVKGLYKKALSGEITDMTGIGDEYEIPNSSDVICYTSKEKVSDSVKSIIKFIKPRLQTKQKCDEHSVREIDDSRMMFIKH
jgi:adenylylsulfate kinase